MRQRATPPVTHAAHRWLALRLHALDDARLLRDLRSQRIRIRRRHHCRGTGTSACCSRHVREARAASENQGTRAEAPIATSGSAVPASSRPVT